MVKCSRGELKLLLTIVFPREPHWLFQEEHKEETYEPAQCSNTPHIEL